MIQSRSRRAHKKKKHSLIEMRQQTGIQDVLLRFPSGVPGKNRNFDKKSWKLENESPTAMTRKQLSARNNVSLYPNCAFLSLKRRRSLPKSGGNFLKNEMKGEASTITRGLLLLREKNQPRFVWRKVSSSLDIHSASMFFGKILSVALSCLCFSSKV